MVKKTFASSKMLQAGPPSSVVMVTCIDSKGKPNIITLGMYMPISHDPSLICIGVSPNRYSHRLIEETGEFVVNVPSIELKDAMHLCGTKSGKNCDKFKEAGLTPIPAERVKPPLIKECFSNLECRVVQRHECGDHTLFVGEVLAARLDEEYLTKDETLDVVKAKPIIQKNHVYWTVGGKH